MKRQIFIGAALVASTLTISAPAHAFKYRLLEVEMTELCVEDVDDSFTLICKYIVRTSDIIACHKEGGQIGAIGTRPACVNGRANNARPRGSPPPFFPEEVMAKSFVPVAVPAEIGTGQMPIKNRPYRKMEPISVPRSD